MRITRDRRRFRRRILNCAKRIEWRLHAVHRQKFCVGYFQVYYIKLQKALSCLFYKL